jgi:hypothetical protein
MVVSYAIAIAAMVGRDVRAQQPVHLASGLVIDRSVLIGPGIYRLSASADPETPAITVRGENLAVDDSLEQSQDGEFTLDAWEPHGSRVDTVPLHGGRRKLKVEHYQIGGFAELRFTIQRK